MYLTSFRPPPPPRSAAPMCSCDVMCPSFVSCVLVDATLHGQYGAGLSSSADKKKKNVQKLYQLFFFSFYLAITFSDATPGLFGYWISQESLDCFCCCCCCFCVKLWKFVFFQKSFKYGGWQRILRFYCLQGWKRKKRKKGIVRDKKIKNIMKYFSISGVKTLKKEKIYTKKTFLKRVQTRDVHCVW